MMLPTSSMRSAGIPSFRRFSSPSGDGVKSRSAITSVTMRLISSGIVRSKLRSPASTCDRAHARASAQTSAHGQRSS